MERKSNTLLATCAALAGLLSCSLAVAGTPQVESDCSPQVTRVAANTPWTMTVQMQNDQAAWDAVQAEMTDWQQRAERIGELHDKAVAAGDTRRARMFEITAQTMTHRRQARIMQLQNRFGGERVQQIRRHLAAGRMHASCDKPCGKKPCNKPCGSAGFAHGPSDRNERLHELAVARAEATVRQRAKTLEHARARHAAAQGRRQGNRPKGHHNTGEARIRDMLRQQRVELRAPGVKGRADVPAPKAGK